MSITPGFYLDTDIETLLVAELASRGTNIEDKDLLRKNLVMHLQEGTANFYWTWDGVEILRFQRDIVTETVVNYSLTIQRKILTGPQGLITPNQGGQPA